MPRIIQDTPLADPNAPPELDIFVPDFCQPRAVAIIIIGAELLAFTLVLANVSGGTDGLTQLAITSLYVQWAALVSGGLLCVSRRGLVRLPTWQSALIAFLIPLLVNLLLTIAAHLLAGQGLLAGTWSAQRTLGTDLSRNLVIAAIVSGVVLRYLYTRHEAEKNLAAQHQARLNALQARIRPHFLFNSLNTIISLVRDQPAVAEEALQDLAELFRHNLRQSNQLTLLSDDIILCKQYLALEQLRLGQRLQAEWQTEELDPNLKIPPLVLQPLLENAVYHGIEPLTDTGTITIAGKLSAENYQLTVTNPLPAVVRPSPQQGHQIAIDNVRQRLLAQFGEQAKLIIDSSAEQYRVTIALPR